MTFVIAAIIFLTSREKKSHRRALLFVDIALRERARRPEARVFGLRVFGLRERFVRRDLARLFDFVARRIALRERVRRPVAQPHALHD